MKALFFKDQAISLVEKPLPQTGPGEALVRTLVAGICNTDLELLKGYYGFSGIAGHEFVGLVESCPDDPSWEGQEVGADINLGCGACPLCASKDSRHCPDRRVLGIVNKDGAFAQYLTLPVTNLKAVPSGLDRQRAVFAEPLAAALEISQQAHIRATEKALVLGDGKLGLLAALCLSRICLGTVLAGKHENKLAIARKQNVDTFLVGENAGLEPLIKKTGLFDWVVEATGSEDGLGLALGCVRPEGCVVAKTTSRNPSLLDLAKVVVDEITLMGSRCGNIGFALDWLEKGLVDPLPLIDGAYPLKEYEKAFAHARRPGAMKVLIDFS